MKKENIEDLAKEWQDFFAKYLKERDKNKQNTIQTAENSQTQRITSTIETFSEIRLTYTQIRIQTLINQNTIQFTENLPKGQENGSSNDGKGFKQPTSTRNHTGNNAKNSATPILQPNATTMRADDTNRGRESNGNAGSSTAGETERFTSDSSLPQDERTHNNNRQSDTSKSQSTAMGDGRAAVGAGLKEFKAIYGIEIKPNEAELKELEPINQISMKRIKNETSKQRRFKQGGLCKALKRGWDF